MSKFITSLITFFSTTILFAQEVAKTVVEKTTETATTVAQPGLEEIGNAIIEIVKNWESLGTLGIMIAIINVLIMLLKSKYCKGWFDEQSQLVKRALIVILGQVVAILAMVLSGSSWIPAILAGLVSSGGAIAIYEVVKPFFKKQ